MTLQTQSPAAIGREGQQPTNGGGGAGGVEVGNLDESNGLSAMRTGRAVNKVRALSARSFLHQLFAVGTCGSQMVMEEAGRV